MNKKFLVAAVAMTLAGLAQAQSNVTLYGIVDTSLEGVKSPNGMVSKEASGVWSGSRFGFRGSEDLGSGLKANFVLESGFNSDDGSPNNSASFFDRRSTVGLSGSFGVFEMGRRDGPFYEFLSVLEPVPDAGGFGLMNDLTNGQSSRGFTRRYSNQFTYETPVMSGFKARVMYALGENNTVAGSDKKNGNTVALYTTYTKGPLYIGYVYTQNKNIATVSTGVAGTPPPGTPTGTASRKYNAVGGYYDFSVVKLFGAYYTDKRNSFFATPASSLTAAIDQRVWWVGASAPISASGANNIAFDYGKIKDKSTDYTAAHPGAQDVRQWAVTYWYNFSKRTNVYAGYSAARTNNFTGISSGISSYNDNVFDTIAVSTASNSVTANSKAYIFGIRHKF